MKKMIPALTAALGSLFAAALLWTAAPAVAVLLVAACSAPGWLWASEFGGYDALSYHLQLPKEWLHLKKITTLDHNVYSHQLEDGVHKTSPGPDPTPESAPECFGGNRGSSDSDNASEGPES